MATIAEKLQTILDAKNDIKAAMKERDLEGNYEPVNDDITGYGDKIRNAYSDVDGMMYIGTCLKKFPSTVKFAPRKHWGLKWENIAEGITNEEKRSEIAEQYFGFIYGEQDGSLLKSEYGDKIIEYLYIMWGDDSYYGYNLFSLNFFLDTLPDIDTSDLDVFDYMFFNCHSLKSVKGLNTHNGRSFTNMLSYCPVETTQDLDMSNALFVDSMYEGTKISHISGLTLPQVVTASMMFCGCDDLIDARDINMPNVIYAEGLFRECKNLTSLSNLNIQNAKRIGSMFNRCSKLESIPKMNVPNATHAGGMFYLCKNLTTVSGLSMPNVTDVSYMFYNCTGLTTITNFSGLKVSIDFSTCTGLTHDSIMVVINGLETVTTTQSLTLGSTNLAKLTDDEKKIATDKGWTLK